MQLCSTATGVGEQAARDKIGPEIFLVLQLLSCLSPCLQMVFRECRAATQAEDTCIFCAGAHTAAVAGVLAGAAELERLV